MDNKLTVLELATDLKLKILCCEKQAANIYIKSIGISRLGFELAGFKIPDDKSQKTALLGGKESKFLDFLKSEKKILESLDNVFKGDKVSVIILSKTFNHEKKVIKLAEKHNIPVLRSNLYTYASILYILPYLSSKLWKREEFHATLVNVFGEGVLLTGASAVGKSETALGLIKCGHFLIADDRVALYSSGIYLHGEPGNKVSRLLEIRGIGIIDVRYMYGHHVTLPSSQISININFVAENDKDAKVDRIGLNTEYVKFFHHEIPKINIQASAARNLTDLVETAVISYKLKKEGHNPINHLSNYLSEIITENSKKNK